MGWVIEDGPAGVDKVDLAFPARGMELTPEAPLAYPGKVKWERLAQHLFSHGADGVEFGTVPGIDPDAAWLHVRVVLGCYGLPHQKKISGVGWLLFCWFGSASWTTTTVWDEPVRHHVAAS